MTTPQQFASRSDGSGKAPSPLVTVVLLNYNGAVWLPKCLESLAAQTIFNHVQVIIADNSSTDGSDRLSEKLIAGWSNGLFIQNGCNPGFGAGTNMAVKHATGRYLFFLNPDVWLEPNCLEELVNASEANKAGAAGLLVLEYDDNTVQSRGAAAFDLCGLGVSPRADQIPSVLFLAHGFTFMRRNVFELIGGYDGAFFLYGEELDLSWRVWTSGELIVYVPAARIHHRGAAAVNPEGGTKIIKLRTTDSKRFFANRNHLLAILKNAQNLLLILLLPAVVLLVVEGLAGLFLFRRWSFFCRTCIDPIRDCWRLRGHIRTERRRIRGFRKRGDFFMLRFFTWRFSRWEQYQRMRGLGLPQVDAK